MAPSRNKTNAVGLEKHDYRGAESSLCAGCGHTSVGSQIITTAFELGLQPEQVVKFSGIGCSSKSPAYFMSRSFAFNAVHGRMPAVASGAMLANRDLIAIGLSGDGDTGSIGLGQFKHVMRRNTPMVYIVENNGVYGLTKGQFSATADEGQVLKHYGKNELPPMDLCLEAIVADCGFVARSFAGDPKQVRPLLKAAISYEGTALLDIVSPCVTFNNTAASTKGYDWARDHDAPLHDIAYVPLREEITADYVPGAASTVTLHDGSHIILRKLDETYDPTDRVAALRALEHAKEEHTLLTGLLYYNPGRVSLIEAERLTDVPLAQLSEAELRPSEETLLKIMTGL